MCFIATLGSLAALYLINSASPEFTLPCSIILGAFIIAIENSSKR